MISDDFFYDDETKYFVLKPQAEAKRNLKESYLKANGFYRPLDKRKILSGRLTEETIKNSLANTLQIVFEVTENCNLDCNYCGYGELYSGKNSMREKKYLPTTYAINLVNHIHELQSQNRNRSLNKGIAISFYGGEPLLNIDFIRAVVEHVKSINSDSFYPRFTMTTNALLLKKHIAFLAENNFQLLISLDGDKRNNSYRVYPNGQDAFDEIIKNIDYVYENYPDYFKKHIEFNSVIHNRNSVSQAFNYIFNRYGKHAKLSELNASGVAENKREEFWAKYRNIYEDLNQSEDYRFIRDKLFVEAPVIGSISKFVHTYTNNVYSKYTDFFSVASNKQYLPTGTCIPFSRKIFLTAKGQILPCERISDEFSTMGYVTDSEVVIEYDKIVMRMNSLYDKLHDKFCHKCFYATRCIQCVFNLDLSKKDIACYGYKHERNSAAIISNNLSELKRERGCYKKLLRDVYYE